MSEDEVVSVVLIGQRLKNSTENKREAGALVAQREILKEGKGHNFHNFFSVKLIIWCWLKNKKGWWGVWGHAPPKKFWKFTCCIGYFRAFSIIFTQILFTFFNLNLECFVKYDAFCLHIFDYACLRRKVYRYQRGSKFWKKCIGLHQNIFLKWLVGRCITLILPRSAPGHKLQRPSRVWHISVTWYYCFCNWPETFSLEYTQQGASPQAEISMCIQRQICPILLSSSSLLGHHAHHQTLL